MEETINLFDTPYMNSEYGENFENTKLRNLPLTMVYAPMQQFGKSYGTQEALMAGTLFPDIDKPFKGRRFG